MENRKYTSRPMKRMPGRGPGVGEKAKDLVGTWKKLLIYCRKYSAALIVCLLYTSS